MNCMWLYIILLAMVAFIIWNSNDKESFSVGSRNFRLCPTITDREHNIMPRAIVFVVQGYNYTDTPIVYRDGKAVTFLQYYWDATDFTYYITVDGLSADPKQWCAHQWTIETSEFVKPVVTEGYSGIELNVKSIAQKDGHNLWNISC